eukprot:31477-Pelagococcus_subviridis.AAC.6
MTTDMLSHPMPLPFVSGAMHSSASDSQIFDSGSSCRNRARMKSTHCCDVRTSQIPSHAMTTNSSPAEIFSE